MTQSLLCVLCSFVRVAARRFITQQNRSGSVVNQRAHVGSHVAQNRVHYVPEESGTHSYAQGVKLTAPLSLCSHRCIVCSVRFKCISTALFTLVVVSERLHGT